MDLSTLKPANLITQHALSAKVVLSGEITRKVVLRGVGATAGAAYGD
jgi:large subunit ribosomal protein L15